MNQLLYNNINFFLRPQYDRMLHRFKSLLKSNDDFQLKSFLTTIDFSQNYDLLFNYFQITCEYEHYGMIDYFIKEYNFDVNKENSRCETILFKLSDLDANNSVIRYLIEKHLAVISPHNTIFYPILNCFQTDLSVNNFKLYLKYSESVDLNIVDQTNCTILYNLISYNDLNLVKMLCSIYLNKYGFKYFRRWVLYNDCITLCFTYNFINIARYLLYAIIENPDKFYLTKKGKFEVKLANSEQLIARKLSDIAIIKHNPTFNEFYIIYSKITHILWDPIELPDIRKLYNLSQYYTFDDIYNAIEKCVINDYRIDFDSVRMFIIKSKEEHYTRTLQCIYRYYKRKKQYSLEEISAKIIQRRWRRHLYLRNSKNKCNICLDYLILKSCQLLECKHIFHKTCLSNWRAIKNHCPNCRKMILNPIISI